MADFSSQLYNIALTTIPKSKPHSKNIILSGSTMTEKQPSKTGRRLYIY